MTSTTALPRASARAGAMTMRVCTMDPAGTVTQDRGTVSVTAGNGLPLPDSSPACQCPLCRLGRPVNR
ncbi:hypothetical protein E2C11_21365 [Streptomyces lavendulae]|nr:hypothetical protein [Streptomyces lavendulae]TXJ76329.1 hypothetical protein E2C11_21365 [Streptomyces lavendulae]